MSQQDIAIVKRFPIINGFVIIPDYGPNKITLASALNISGVNLNSPINSVETSPGIIECCGNEPADTISETIKDEVDQEVDREVDQEVDQEEGQSAR